MSQNNENKKGEKPQLKILSTNPPVPKQEVDAPSSSSSIQQDITNYNPFNQITNVLTQILNQIELTNKTMIEKMDISNNNQMEMNKTMTEMNKTMTETNKTMTEMNKTMTEMNKTMNDKMEISNNYLKKMNKKMDISNYYEKNIANNICLIAQDKGEQVELPDPPQILQKQ